MTTDNVHMVKATLHELAGHVYTLAIGLQNAAPPGPAPASVQYLLDTASRLKETSFKLEQLISSNPSPKRAR